MEIAKYESIPVPDGGWCPNNMERPLLIYRQVFSGEPEELAERFEEVFRHNGWPPAWRYTIYDFPHYHSTSHEVIGVFRGEATVRFGDSAGILAELRAGDVVVIPAGVSHQLMASEHDFQAVGAYPEGCEVDQWRPEDSDPVSAAARVRAVPIPAHDPVGGPLVRHWHEG